MILEAAVLEFIRTGEPVASGSLVGRYALSLSPASIRKSLAELESLGLLRQAHASAGRTPTEEGFRLYADDILEVGRLPEGTRAAIDRELAGREPGYSSLFRLCSRLLSDLTCQVGVVIAPGPEMDLLRKIYFLRLERGRMLAVLVSEGGAIRNLVLALAEDISREELNQVNAVLEGIEAPYTLPQLKERLVRLMGQDRREFERLYFRALALAEATGQASEGESERDIIMDEEGRGRLFEHPDFKDAQAMRALYRAFEDKRRLVALLDEITGGGRIRVVIGPSGLDKDGLALVASPYFQGGQAAGSVGVLGPRRLNYPEIVPVVDYAARALSGLIGT
jgi:heat-inducible transcriptional repressor